MVTADDVWDTRRRRAVSVTSRAARLLRELYADVVVRTGGIRTNLKRVQRTFVDRRALSTVLGHEPWLRDVLRVLRPCARKLRGRYSQYTNFVSNPGNALSLRSSALLYALCETLQPASILDLGSGFSSYVTRTYQAESTSQIVVVSVDDSPEWLLRTRDYLERVELSYQELCTLEEFESRDHVPFDLVVYDLGSMDTRTRWLGQAISYIKPVSGVGLIDDCHFPNFAGHVTATTHRAGGNCFDIASITRDQFGRFSFLLTGLQD